MTTTDPIAPAGPTEEEALPRPRIRTGAVIWGLVLVALAVTVLWTVADADRRDAAVDAVAALDGFGWTIVGVIAFGGILTLIALAAVIRRIQKRPAARGADLT